MGLSFDCIYIHIPSCFLLHAFGCFHVFPFAVLENINQDHLEMAFDRELLADNLLYVAGAKIKKQRARNPDTLTGAGVQEVFPLPNVSLPTIL